MRRRTVLTVTALLPVWVSCEKELSITDFASELGYYQSELKVEGLLRLDRPGDSIIRITRTIPVTDERLYDGADDDGDGDVDEHDEVWALVQDTSATVTVTEVSSGDRAEFHYVAVADSAVHIDEAGGDSAADEEAAFLVPYGGYKPASPGFELQAHAQYRLEIYSREFDTTVTGVTTVYPQVEFIDTLFTFSDGLVTMHTDDEKEIFWTSDLEVTAYYLRIEELEEIDDGEWQSAYVDSYAGGRDNELTEAYRTTSVGRGLLWWVDYDAVLRLTVESLSPAYGRYIFSDLPLNDRQRSNLRDQDGKPVMGSFGATAARSIVIVVEE